MRIRPYTPAMAAFTPINDALLAEVLAPFGLQPVGWHVAAEGVENSNYFVTARAVAGPELQLVLTIFEQFDADAVPWFIELLDRLAALGLPVPQPLRAAGRALREVAGKPAVLVPRLPGRHLLQPGPQHCRQIGAVLALVHQCRIGPPAGHSGPAGQLQALLPWLQTLPPADRQLAEPVLDRWSRRDGEPVLCHGDLFRDNALFDGDRLSGLLDFHNAGHELAVWDLAVAANDWCVSSSGVPDPAREQALLDGYRQHRGLDAEARQLLPLAMAVAALRFWLSRLRPTPDSVTGESGKDPDVFARIFRQRCRVLAESGASAPGPEAEADAQGD